MSLDQLNIEKIRADKIRDFYIIHRDGYSIFHRAYVKSKVDDVLLSGFLTAIFNLSEELSIDQIHVMDMKDFKFIYEYRHPYIFILNVLMDVDPIFGKNLLSQIIDYYNEVYNSFSEEIKEDLNELAHQLREMDFDTKLDSFVNKAIIEGYLESPVQLLGEIESFINSLFGSLGNQMIDSIISKICGKRENFNMQLMDGFISELEVFIASKMNAPQAKQITQQIKSTFLST